MFSRLRTCAPRISRVIAAGLLAGSINVHAIAAYSEAQFRSVTTDNEARINEIRDQEIEHIKVVLGRRFAESRRPDILLRLAELYIEKYRFYFFKENEIHQAALRKGARPKYVDHTRSRAFLKSAESACLSILRSKVRFEKMDQVYYFLAYNAQELGKQKDALKYFETIVSRYPKSQYAAESYRNIAEAEFSKNNYKKSVQYYEKAARFTELASYPRTLYKLAWAYFKVRDKNRALTTMKQVVARSQEDDKFIGLKEEALNDLVMFYAEAGRAKEAHAYFSNIKGGPELYVKALNKLASLYGSQGRHEMSLTINEELIRLYSEDRPDLVFEALGKNVELYRKRGKVEQEQRALERLVAHMEKYGDAVSKSEDALATIVRVKSYLRNRAGEVHKNAQKKKSKALYSRAADLYGLYIKAFSSSAEGEKERNDLNQLRIYKSDCLLAAGREDQALNELETALNESGESKLKREAGATALNLLIKRLDQTQNPSDDLEKRFTRLAETFEEKFPKDPLSAEVRYKRARLAARRSGSEGLSSNARKALNELIELYPTRPESVLAAQDLVDDLRKQKKDEEAAELAGGFLTNEKLMAADKKQQLRKYLEAIIARESFARVKELEKDQSYEKAAREYEALAAASKKDSEVVFKSLNNAAVNYEKAGLVSDAERVYRRLNAEFRKSDVGRDGLKRLADKLLYEEKFSEAAKAFRELASISSFSSSEKTSFSELAVTLYYDLGNYGNAYILLDSLFREMCVAPKGQVAKSLYGKCRMWEFDQGEILLDAGRHQDALAHFRRVSESKSAFGSRRAEAAYRAALIYEKFGEKSKAGAMFERTAALAPKSSRDGWVKRELNFSARAAFKLVEPSFAAFDGIKLQLPEAALKNNTKKKLSELERLVVRYNRIVSLGDGEWGVAALERLGRAFQGFGKELVSAPVPPSLSEDQKAQYAREINSIAVPMGRKARDYFEQAYKLGIRLKIATETFDRVRASIGAYLPKQTPPAQYFHEDYAKDSFWGLQFVSSPTEVTSYAEKLKQNPKNASAWLAFGNKMISDKNFRLAKAFFEQAIATAGKSGTLLGGAWNNLAVLSAVRGELIDAQTEFEKAMSYAELDDQIQSNLAKFFVYYGQYARAKEILRKLKGRMGEKFDGEISVAYGVALLGSGDFREAKHWLSHNSAKSSSSPTLWYNWVVLVILSGNADDRQDAAEMLKDKRSSLPKEMQWIADEILSQAQ